MFNIPNFHLMWIKINFGAQKSRFNRFLVIFKLVKSEKNYPLWLYRLESVHSFFVCDVTDDKSFGAKNIIKWNGVFFSLLLRFHIWKRKESVNIIMTVIQRKTRKKTLIKKQIYCVQFTSKQWICQIELNFEFDLRNFPKYKFIFLFCFSEHFLTHS